MRCLMDHIVLNVEDEEKMIAFYSKILMFAPERLEEYRAGDVPFPSVRLNSDTIIDLFPKKIWQKSARAGQGRENLNHFCIALSKRTWKDLLERLQANNAIGSANIGLDDLLSQLRFNAASNKAKSKGQGLDAF